MSGGLFTNQLLRETGIAITAEKNERLRQLHAASYRRLGTQIKPLPGARELLRWLSDETTRCRALGVGLLSGGYGREELRDAGAIRVYEDPADFLHNIDEVGGRR